MRETIRNLCQVLILLLVLGMTAAAVRAAQPESGEKRKLTITVVEDIPAVDIEENEVPLAALPETRTRSGDLTAAAALAAAAVLLAAGNRLRRRKSRKEREAILRAYAEKRS